jgi:Lrp/AsnC family transcriptional regulator for asnA, asnC and gidA
MVKSIFDSLNRKIVRLLAEDGRISVRDIATHIGVTAPTVRSRVKNLISSGMLKIAGMINPDNHKGLITAIIGINIQSYGKLDEALEKLANIDQVRWVAVVTGRYDVFAEVVVFGGMAELHLLMTKVIPKIGRVTQTETFVITKSRSKWISLPQNLKDW